MSTAACSRVRSLQALSWHTGPAPRRGRAPSPKHCRRRHCADSFASTGWLDPDWIWEPAFDELSKCGLPLGNATGAPAPLVFTRAYEHCSFAINCTVTAACTTTANIGGAALRGPMRAAHGGASKAAHALKRAI